MSTSASQLDDFASAEAVQAAFYEAFARGDRRAMQRLWVETDDAICVHPTGDALLGRALIDGSWAAILAGGGAGKIEFEPLTTSTSTDLAIFTGYEHITPSGSRIPFPPVLATNIYRKTQIGWRMLGHHASPIMQPRATPPATPGDTRH